MMKELKEWRKGRKMTQAELAELFGVTQGMISHYEKGVRDIPAERAREYSEITRIPLHKFRPDIWPRKAV